LEKEISKVFLELAIMCKVRTGDVVGVDFGG
jgi:hypothetical protein